MFDPCSLFDFADKTTKIRVRDLEPVRSIFSKSVATFLKQ